MFKCTILVGLCSRARKLTWEFSNLDLKKLESNKMKMAVLICFINVCLRHILSNDI
jgi:hypothetical protein